MPVTSDSEPAIYPTQGSVQEGVSCLLSRICPGVLMLEGGTKSTRKEHSLLGLLCRDHLRRMSHGFLILSKIQFCSFFVCFVLFCVLSRAGRAWLTNHRACLSLYPSCPSKHLLRTSCNSQLEASEGSINLCPLLCLLCHVVGFFLVLCSYVGS